MLGLPMAVVVLGAAIAAGPLLPAIAGDDYAPASRVAQILIAGAAVGVGFFWVRPGFLALGLVRPLFVLSSIAGATTVVCFLLVAPAGGAVGIAIVRAVVAGLIGSLVNASVLLVLARRGGASVPIDPPLPEFEVRP